MDDKALAPNHEEMLLEESGIEPEIVDARGYRTVETKAELGRLGFSEKQRNVPGLLLPLYGPDGEVANYQYRPDQPKVNAGKPVKYETPSGSRMVLDVHPHPGRSKPEAHQGEGRPGRRPGVR